MPSRERSIAAAGRTLVVAVVIPAFRTERHIRDVVTTIPAAASLIIVVDDQSPDRTAMIVSELQCRDDRIVLHRHEFNEGVGGAMCSGYRIALQHGADIIVKMDGDGQMDSSQLGRLIAPIVRGRADYTKGNRFLHATELGSMPATRRIGNLALSFLTKIASGYWNVFDPTNGYTAIHAAALARLDINRLGRRYFFETSMLIELGVVGAVVRDVPMPARYGDERSGLSLVKTVWDFPPKLLRGWLRRTWSRHFLRDFTPLALLLAVGLAQVAAGSAWGAAWWWRSWRTGIPASTGTVMLAVLPLILGAQCLLHALLLDVEAVPRKPLQRSARARARLRSRLHAAAESAVPPFREGISRAA